MREILELRVRNRQPEALPLPHMGQSSTVSCMCEIKGGKKTKGIGIRQLFNPERRVSQAHAWSHYGFRLFFFVFHSIFFPLSFISLVSFLFTFVVFLSLLSVCICVFVVLISLLTVYYTRYRKLIIVLLECAPWHVVKQVFVYVWLSLFLSGHYLLLHYTVFELQSASALRTASLFWMT